MKPWFNSTERFDLLRREAQTWLGTPFLPNGNTKGKGVSCQKLAAELYRAIGFCDIMVPDVAMQHGRFSSTSKMEEWLRTRNEFSRMERQLSPPRVGDLVGFRMGKVVHHMGVMLDDSRFIHAMEGLGVVVNSLSDATWGKRFVALWRPIT